MSIVGVVVAQPKLRARELIAVAALAAVIATNSIGAGLTALLERIGR